MNVLRGKQRNNSVRIEDLMLALMVGTHERSCETAYEKFCHRRRRRKGSRRRELSAAAAADAWELFRRRRSNDRLTPLLRSGKICNYIFYCSI